MYIIICVFESVYTIPAHHYSVLLLSFSDTKIHQVKSLYLSLFDVDRQKETNQIIKLSNVCFGCYLNSY